MEIILIIIVAIILTIILAMWRPSDKGLVNVEKYIKCGWSIEEEIIKFVNKYIIENNDWWWWWWQWSQKEGFIVSKNVPSNSSIDAEIKNMSLPTILTSNIKSCKNITYPLSQYAIKGSYNTANSGNYVSTKAIHYVISRGCRFLDFEVYIDENEDKPSLSSAIVAYSMVPINNTTNTKTVKLDSKNTITLDDALSACISKAFSASISPNYDDPLFIQLRLKTGKSSLQPIVNSINYRLMDKLHMDPIEKTAINVNAETELKTIMGKIILVVDAGLNDITLMKPYINILSNTENWKKYYYRNIDNMSINPPTININTELNNLTSIKNLSMVTPASSIDTKIPSPFSIFSEYGFQTLLIPFYSINNENIKQYEQLFNTTKGGVVPISTIISYSTDMLNGV